MRFYKLLLALPMLAFVMEANAAATYDCWQTYLPGQANRGGNEYLFLNAKSEDYNAASSSCSHCKGKALVCGHKAGSFLGIGGGIGGDGCYTGAKVVIDGTYTWKDTQSTGRTVFECDRNGGNEWYHAGATMLVNFGNCEDSSNFKKGDKYEEMFTDGGRTYYCINSRIKRAGAGKACIAQWPQAFCYMTKNQSACYDKKLNYDKQNDTCKCKNKNENYIDGKCVKDINNLDDQNKCAKIGGTWSNGVCNCPTGEYYDQKDKHCKAKNECKDNSICNSQVIMLSDFGNTNVSVHGGNVSDSGNSTNTNSNYNENHNNSHNTNGDGAVVNGSCTAAQSGKVESVACATAANIGLDITNAKECARECDGQNWLYFKKSCETGFTCEERKYGTGLGCQSCTKGGKNTGGRSGGGSGGGSSCLNRPTAEGRACCRAGKDTTFKNNVCACVDTTKEWKYTDGAEYGQCVTKGSTEVVNPCDAICTNYVSIVVDNCAMQKVNNYANVITQITQQCANRANCNATTVGQLVNQIEVAVANCAAQPVEPAKPEINKQRLSDAVAAVDKYRSGLDVSVWKDEQGNFNTARLVSDSIAGVVLGTAGGLITSSVVKKNQIKSGFEDIVCTIGGQTVGSYGDEISVGIQ